MGEDCCFLTFIGARQVGLGALCWLAPWLYYPGTLVALRIKLRVQENIQVGSPTSRGKVKKRAPKCSRNSFANASTNDFDQNF